MDVNGVYQCLAYVQSLKSDTDWVVPIAGVLVGFLLSSCASWIASYRREGRIKKSVMAEIAVVKSQAEITFVAAVELAYHIRSAPHQASTFEPAATIHLFLYEQLFSSVAHSFTTVQNQQFQYVQAHVKTVNEMVDSIMDALPKPGGPKFWDTLYKLILDSARLAYSCEGVQKGRDMGKVKAAAFAAKLGVDQSVISSVL